MATGAFIRLACLVACVFPACAHGVAVDDEGAGGGQFEGIGGEGPSDDAGVVEPGKDAGTFSPSGEPQCLPGQIGHCLCPEGTPGVLGCDENGYWTLCGNCEADAPG